jgi:hypothetical protein
VALAHFYQRDPITHSADIPIDGVAGKIMQNGVNVTGWVGGDVIHDVAQGVYVLVEREADGSTILSKFAIGEDVAALGQSDMSAWFLGTPLAPPSADTFMLAHNGLWGGVHGAAAVEFCNTLSADLGCPVAIENCAKGNTSLLEQDATNPRNVGWWLDGPLYQDALDTQALAGTNPGTVLLDEGESDAVVHVDATAFETGLFQFLGDIERDFGAPQIFIQEADKDGAWKPSAASYYAAVGDAEEAAANDLGYVHIGADGTGLPLLDGGPHYIAPAYITLADEMVNSIWQYDLLGLV